MPRSEITGRDALEKELDELRERVAELEARDDAHTRLVATLRDGEARTRAVIEQASDAIAVCDLRGTMLDANAACIEMLGYTLPEIRAIGLLALIHPDDLAAQPIRVAEVKTGRTVRGVRRFVRKDGTTFLGETSTKRLEDGRVQFVVRDISQQMQAEQDLKREAASVRVLQQVAMAANEATGWSDALSRCLAAVCDAMGWELGHVYVPDLAHPERLVSSHLWHAEELSRFAAFCAATERTALSCGDDFSGRAFAQGAPEWVADLSNDSRCPRSEAAGAAKLRSAVACPVLFGGETVAVLEFFALRTLDLDARLLEVMTHVGVQLGHVIERQRSRAALRRAHEAQDLLLRSLPCLLLCVDEHGCITHCNERAAVALELDPEGVLGRPLAEVEIPAGLERLRDLVELCRSEGAGLRIDELRHLRRDGATALLEVTARPIRYRGKAGCSVLLVGTDITEVKRLQTSVVAARRLESIGQLAAGIAHEVNTPMQFVGDNVRFLRDAFSQLRSVLDESRAHPPDVDLDFLLAEIPRALTQSEDGVAQISSIVRAMKDMSHPGRVEKAPVDLNKAVENAATVSRHEWREGADVEFSLAPELPLVPCHLGQVSQALLNILVNAGHALRERARQTGRRGTIRVSTHRDGEWIEIRVADDGPGIPEAIRARVFDPFFTTKEVGHGTGQGLAIARAVIVDKHGGELRFDSEPGRGTTFFVRLPIVAPERGVVRGEPERA